MQLFVSEGKVLLWRKAESRLKQDGYDSDIMMSISQELNNNSNNNNNHNKEEDLDNNNSSSTNSNNLDNNNKLDNNKESQEYVLENDIVYTLCAASDQKTGFTIYIIYEI